MSNPLGFGSTAYQVLEIEAYWEGTVHDLFQSVVSSENHSFQDHAPANIRQEIV